MDIFLEALESSSSEIGLIDLFSAVGAVGREATSFVELDDLFQAISMEDMLIGAWELEDLFALDELTAAQATVLFFIQMQ